MVPAVIASFSSINLLPIGTSVAFAFSPSSSIIPSPFLFIPFFLPFNSLASSQPEAAACSDIFGCDLGRPSC